MLRSDQKYRFNREADIQNKKIQKNKDQKYESFQLLTRRKKSARQCTSDNIALEKMQFYKENRIEYNYEKQNRGMNEVSPQHYYNYEKEKQFAVEDVDSLSQIRFFSKECSSIKENNVDIDCNSEALSRNQLQDFSPLFDRIQKNSSDDFILEIQDITESQPSIQQQMYRKCESTRQIRGKYIEQQSSLQQSDKSMKSGKIKKNRGSQKIQSACGREQQNDVDKQIEFVFSSLDGHREGILSKNNCKNQNLSTELNYFIGSILTKIKVKGKQYNFTQFKQQFVILIKDSDPSELREIFGSNRLKKKKVVQNNNTEEEEEKGNFSFQKNKHNNQLSQRLSKIDEKLIFYLQKNNLPSGVTYCSTNNTNLVPTTLTNSKKQQQNRVVSYKRYQQINISTQILEGKCYSEKNNKSDNSQQIRTQISLRSDSQTIKGVQGGEFQLCFTQLNKHI